MHMHSGVYMTKKKKGGERTSKTSVSSKKDLEVGNSSDLEFTVETGKSISAISRRVADMSSEGWWPLGGAFFFYTDNGTPAFAQSLSRKEKSNPKVKYLIQTGKSPSALASRVNLKIAEGLNPIGSGFVFRSDDGTLIYCQTMVSGKEFDGN